MKKITGIIVCVVMVFMVVSCGDANTSETKQGTETAIEISTEDIRDLEPKKKITEQTPIYEKLVTERNISKPEEYISYKWFSEQEEDVIVKSGEVFRYPFEITNISEFDFELEFPYMKNVTITNSSGETIKQTMLGSSETLELTVSFEINDIRRFYNLYGGGCRFESYHNGIFGSCTGYEFVKRLYVEREDAPTHQFIWERDLNNQHVELLPEIEIDDYILLVNYHDNSRESESVFYDVLYSFTYINSKTGEEVWNIPKDVFGDEKIVDYYELDNYLVFYTDSFEFPGASFNKKEYKPLKTPYLADKHSGEILSLEKPQIREIVDKQKLDSGIKYEVYRHKEADSNIASIYDVEQNKVTWTLTYDKMYDLQITDDAIYFSYSLADSDIYSDSFKNIVSKYSFDGTLLKQIENPDITIFVYSYDNLFFESGRIDFGDISYQESSVFLHGFVSMGYVEIEDIALINQETLETIWSKRIGENHEQFGYFMSKWNRWYFEKDEMIAFSGSKITSVNISNGNTLWEMEPDFTNDLNPSNTQVNDGYLEILTGDSNIVPPYKKEFYNLKTGELIPGKTELVPKHQLGFEKRVSSDGYIVFETEWYDPDTFEVLGSIAESSYSYDHIIDIRDGYVYYRSNNSAQAENSEDISTTYLICKKLE